MKTKKTYNKSGLFIGLGLLFIAGVTYGATLLFTKNNNQEEYAEENIYGCSQSSNEKDDIGSCGMGSFPIEETLTTTETKPTVEELLTYETVNVGHDQFAMDPEITTLKSGKNYKLIITPSANGGGCMSTLTIPGIDNNIYRIRKDIPITITINNAKAGKYEVICGSMGMYQGQINIE